LKLRQLKSTPLVRDSGPNKVVVHKVFGLLEYGNKIQVPGIFIMVETSHTGVQVPGKVIAQKETEVGITRSFKRRQNVTGFYAVSIVAFMSYHAQLSQKRESRRSVIWSTRRYCFMLSEGRLDQHGGVLQMDVPLHFSGEPYTRINSSWCLFL
jgi:hypothetical protein